MAYSTIVAPVILRVMDCGFFVRSCLNPRIMKISLKLDSTEGTP